MEWLVPIGVAIVAGVVWFVRRRRGPIRVDASGIFVVRSPSNPLFLSWEEIDSFGVACVASVEGGLRLPGFTQYVGVRLTVTSEKRRSKVCADNRELSDYDVLLTPDRGTSIEQFAVYLETEKRRFKRANPECCVPRSRHTTPVEGTRE